MIERDAPSERILLGGKVITMSQDADQHAQGIVIRGDRIVRLIRRDQVEQFRTPSTVITDLGDRTLMPGFVDVHAHAEVVCRTTFNTIDCRAPECSSIEDVSALLAKARDEKAPGEWIVGQGNLFFDRKLREGRLPTREELDSVSLEHPIAIRAGGHITVLNSKALEVAGIDRDYVPPEFSVTGLPIVERDENGDPTGVVKEMDTLLPLPGCDRSTLKSALKEGLFEYFTRFGVTTIGEISETVEGIQCMDEMACEGTLPVAMRVYIWAPGTMELDEACNWQEKIQLNASEHMIRMQGIKLFADGGFSAKSAAVSCPYLGLNGQCGEIAFPKYFFRRAYEQSQKSGLQLAVHANGDRAQEWLCELVESMGGASSGRTRMRIEHAGNFMPRQKTMEAWAAAGIIPVPQPVFIYTFGEYFPDYLGDTGRIGRFPFKDLLAQGWKLSGSSDVWIGSEREATNPLFSVWCCVKRQTYSGSFIDPEQAITLEQALRMHTLDAAATMGEEDIRGSITPGKLADIIALDRDPFAVPVDELRKIKVEYVLTQGRAALNLTC
ncbi:amidohydrolase [Pseudomonas aeruginosa]|uniref:amidohydrolase n=1 Tax=Pseudomonas TaxID=286 RepID=UPI0015FB9CE2|nr:amidohydrolase [Pseudomonas putida]ELF6203526.1 amidohydrolase [Pseudomonas putida]MDD2039078.1 amidohydrolase [Pseudomonas putida]MDD2044714.1 amidohydrolase [Pseudomonas putida]